jgi:hypothetical protein
MEKIVFIGFVITVEGIKMDEEKVKVIWDWPVPKSISEVRSFYVIGVF